MADAELHMEVSGEEDRGNGARPVPSARGDVAVSAECVGGASFILCARDDPLDEVRVECEWRRWESCSLLAKIRLGWRIRMSEGMRGDRMPRRRWKIEVASGEKTAPDEGGLSAFGCAREWEE